MSRWRQIKATAATLPVLASAALYVLPAEGQPSQWVGGVLWAERLVHGWPLVFASRYFNDLLPASQSYAWSIGESLEWWSTPALLFDAALVGLLCGLVWYVSFRFCGDQRPRFHFSLRGILIGMVLCAVSANWVAQRVRWHLADQRLAARGCFLARSGIESIWLRELLGFEGRQLLCVPETLSHDSDLHRLQDADLQAVRSLPTLRTIDIHASHITDSGIAHLTTCRQLEYCTLIKSRATDAGVRLLTQLPELRYLDLSGAAVTDDAIDDLLTMKRLKYLRLCGTQLTAAGVRRLEQGLPADCLLERGRNCTRFGYRDLPDAASSQRQSAASRSVDREKGLPVARLGRIMRGGQQASCRGGGAVHGSQANRRAAPCAVG